ncbi:hypothetical protein VN97_g8998 [Penicillium thymicola]|uniref:Uncharacterized protein n=1 Tax=Penicillium thymicola TaxID=293382 RepID=A0AAI9TD58_PENTH|nr:hypothetical protein VN97_g8998 [Penicillium thymicola]
MSKSVASHHVFQKKKKKKKKKKKRKRKGILLKMLGKISLQALSPYSILYCQSSFVVVERGQQLHVPRNSCYCLRDRCDLRGEISFSTCFGSGGPDNNLRY